MFCKNRIYKKFMYQLLKLTINWKNIKNTNFKSIVKCTKQISNFSLVFNWGNISLKKYILNIFVFKELYIVSEPVMMIIIIILKYICI